MLSLSNLPDSLRGLTLSSGKFQKLLGWSNRDVVFVDSLEAFLNSCNTFLKMKPNSFVGSKYIYLEAKDWVPACRAASQVDIKSNNAVRLFFEKNFVPVEFMHGKPVSGLFTGYYVPKINGSLTQTNEYSVPIYALPKDLIIVDLQQFSLDLPHKKLAGRVLGGKLVPFYTREEINNGAIVTDTPVIAWVNNEVDRLILETEGSGVIDLGNNQDLVVGFAGTNGGEYKSVASILIKNKIFREDDASMDNIKKFFDIYPLKLKEIINKNKSFVFFRKLPNDIVVGSQGVKLTPGYSMAVDRKWIPMGVPLWLTTSMYDKDLQEDKFFNRLMIAQDAGGSIKGIVRGDIYFGEGEQAKNTAVHIKNKGHYWLLLPIISGNQIGRE
ncbi:MAG: hypothetical protein A3E88_04120 [Legionellales bacterium RIFCSPHIGHO2_12_FULL_35_11]|nr:MAG: hypothetical protein A3E88_04120 [Legionellales bacterium RIFCSPHIGHO2_12_FULL_35_11]